MSYYAQSRPLNASDASSSSSISLQDHNNSTATSSTSPRTLDLPEDSDDPSFNSQRVATSTPRKTRRLGRRGEEEEERDQEELRLSDTESLELLDDRAIEKGMERFEEQQQQARLTRRSLATHLEERDLLQPYYSNSLTPRGISVPQAKFVRGELYAPSPSTGSSTLVEREEEGFSKLRGGGGEGETTLRRNGKSARRSTRAEDIVYENEEEEEDQRTEMQSFSSARNGPQEAEEEDGSSSSPGPSTRRSTVGDLATYIDARLSTSAPPSSTPRRSPKSRRHLNSALPPQTPHAPGAFPSSTRKSRPSPPPSSETPARPLSSSTRQKTPPSNGSSSAQIHDAFARLITGPKGALTTSAERRIAMQQATPGPNAAGGSKREREKVETPDFAGRYTFVPSSSLPVEKHSRKIETQESEDEEQARPTNLEKALKRVEGKEKGSDFAQRRREEYELRRKQELQRSQLAEETEEEEIPASEEDEIRIAQRSAIDFAMARSFVDQLPEEEASAEESSSADDRRRPERQPSDLRSSVRFAEPDSPPRRRSRTPTSPPSPPSPPRQQNRSQLSSNSRPIRSPSPELPDLPPLPPLLAPDSPEPIRNLPSHSSFRRSNSVSRRPSFLRDPVLPDSPTTPPRQPVFESQPPRSPSPPSSPQLLDPPKSSTPPRRTVQPPNPDATPPRASPSPLARRTLKSSPKRSIPPRSPSPPLEPATALEPSPLDLEVEEDLSIPLLVNQLSAAVRALTAAHTSPKASPRRTRQAGESSMASDDRLARELTKRKEDSQRKRRALEEELLQLESRDQAELDQRNEVVKQLAETYEIEHELGYKVEELRKSIAEMGQLVGDQVAQSVNDTLTAETRKRAHWLALAFCFQLGLFWILLRLANAQSSSLLDSGYYDPFQPHFFNLPINPYAPDAALHPDTIALFTPYVTSHSSWSGIETTASILKGSIEKFGKLATKGHTFITSPLASLSRRSEVEKLQAVEYFRKLVELRDPVNWGGTARSWAFACIYLTRNFGKDTLKTTVHELLCGLGAELEPWILAQHITTAMKDLELDWKTDDPVLLLRPSLETLYLRIHNTKGSSSFTSAERKWLRDLAQTETAAVLKRASDLVGGIAKEHLEYCSDAYAYTSLLIAFEEVFKMECPDRSRFHQEIAQWCSIAPLQVRLICRALSPYTDPLYLRMDPEDQLAYRAMPDKTFVLPGTGYMGLKQFCASYDE
ncbi:hypothetical protein JCM3765_000478 [Sporobolomyces pararoseus]